MPAPFLVTATSRDAAERAIARHTTLTHHGGQPLGAYERHVLASRVIEAATKHGDTTAAERGRVITALHAGAALDRLAGLDQTDTTTLEALAATVIDTVHRSGS